jgi:uncharacterized protein (DUF488 family)
MMGIMDAPDSQKQTENRQVACPAPSLSDRLFSVGHSNHDWADLLALLQGAGVTAVADIRSNPFSRRLPHFSRPELESALRRHGMAYVFLGDLLGGRPAARELYHPEGWAEYERIRATPAFRCGLDRLIRGLEHFTIAMLCSEEDPLDCHRGLMITPALKEHGIFPRHLRKHGPPELTEEMEKRLLKEAGLGDAERSLFPLTDEAYRVLNRKKAYRLPRDEGCG